MVEFCIDRGVYGCCGYLNPWWTFQALYRNHRKTRPLSRATTAPTTIIVMVVVLEKLDDVDVCDGSGVTGVEVVCETGGVVLPGRRLLVVGPARLVLVEAAAAAAVWTAAGVDAERKALKVPDTRPQPRKTVAPWLNKNFAASGIEAGLVN